MSLYISNFRNVFKERIILIIPFVIVFILAMHFLVPNSDEYRIIENNSFWKKKTFDKEKYNVVVCGDSRVYRGVSPDHMKKELSGYSIVNFGYGSAGYDKIMLNEIDKRINRSSDRKVIVLGVTPLNLTHKGALNYHLNFELETTREELIELIYFKRILQFFIPTSLNQIHKRLGGKRFKVSKHQKYIDGGWVATYEDNPDSERALKNYSTYFADNQVLDEITSELSIAISNWKNDGIDIFVFRPPTTHKMVALEDSVSGYIEQYIKEKLESAGAIWFEFNIDDYFSFDGSHLEKESAMKFSRDLASKIRKELKEENKL